MRSGIRSRQHVQMCIVQETQSCNENALLSFLENAKFCLRQVRSQTFSQINGENKKRRVFAKVVFQYILRKQVQEIGGRERGSNLNFCLSLSTADTFEFLNFWTYKYIVNNYHGALHSVSLANDDDDFVPLHCHLLCYDHGLNT